MGRVWLSSLDLGRQMLGRCAARPTPFPLLLGAQESWDAFPAAQGAQQIGACHSSILPEGHCAWGTTVLIPAVHKTWASCSVSRCCPLLVLLLLLVVGGF